MRIPRSLSLLISLPLLLGLGCKERDRSTDVPAAEGPYGTAPPPPGSTTRPSSTTHPAESGRAVAPQSNAPGGGAVIVDGPGPGSPGTR